MQVQLRLEEAERTFDHLLRLDAECPEAKKARRRVMAKQLMQLGFSVEQSEAAALHYNSVKTAAESLTATRLSSSSALSEVFDSDDEEAMLTDCWSKSSTCSSSGRSSAHVLPVNSTSPPIAEQQNVDPLLDWKNPLHWPTLWVGNLGPATTEKIISQMFT
uniref:Uncharacterized protein n=1 Tax=Plectus sambesii TaxID=2011161 RepID=A0A914UM92_9BILA